MPKSAMPYNFCSAGTGLPIHIAIMNIIKHQMVAWNMSKNAVAQAHKQPQDHKKEGKDYC